MLRSSVELERDSSMQLYVGICVQGKISTQSILFLPLRCPSFMFYDITYVWVIKNVDIADLI
jgi:hypothetical protein